MSHLWLWQVARQGAEQKAMNLEEAAGKLREEASAAANEAAATLAAHQQRADLAMAGLKVGLLRPALNFSGLGCARCNAVSCMHELRLSVVPEAAKSGLCAVSADVCKDRLPFIASDYCSRCNWITYQLASLPLQQESTDRILQQTLGVRKHSPECGHSESNWSSFCYCSLNDSLELVYAVKSLTSCLAGK